MGDLSIVSFCGVCHSADERSGGARLVPGLKLSRTHTSLIGKSIARWQAKSLRGKGFFPPTFRKTMGKPDDRVPVAEWTDDGQRPMQMFTRWHGFSYSFPGCNIVA